MVTPRVVTLIGTPRPRSQTRAVAALAARAIGGRIGPVEQEILDLSALAAALGSASASAVVETAVEMVREADVLVVASPSHKGTYTGLLKTFLDRLPSGALTSAVALPLLVLSDPRHALAVEVHLRPALVELGAFVPTPGAVLLESRIERAGEILDGWAGQVAPQVAAVLGTRAAAA
ncbi:NAD(P)H-dependent oxidoreductase [Actinomadura chokoriensis]|uniref:NAD(P)H-dependent oxidoreductase n=1 Tax=Actinomadura chokoriensis TaxID=454156 RepID=A0ABV4QVY2_9ACTN